METLTRRYGESFMASTKVDFVLTCPAVWSDAAKNTTLQAAERAGMGQKSEIQMISEPEAAAVYTLKAIQPNHLSAGDNFVVCDAGGGTVDLIAYKIISLKPLRVEESAVGTGGLCGSAFLNYRFEEHVRGRIGKERFDEMKLKKGKCWQMGLRYWEEFVKRNFNEEEHAEVNVPFPGLPDDEEAGLDCGFLVMTAAQIKEIFEPVVKEVCDLVQGQVDGIRQKGGIVSGIVLVGGFGQSNYLYTRLKGHFNTAAPPPYSERPTHAQATALIENGSVEVMQPVNAWTAVVRGAVLRGLEGSMVISRKSRMHYGTSYATVYDEDKHQVSERYWSPLWERWMVSDRMQWHISSTFNPLPFVPSPFLTMPQRVKHSALLLLSASITPGTSGKFPSKPSCLPFSNSYQTWTIPNRIRRPHRIRRRRRPTLLLHARSYKRLHAHHRSGRRAKKSLHEVDDHKGGRVRQLRLHARDGSRECRTRVRA